MKTKMNQNYRMYLWLTLMGISCLVSIGNFSTLAHAECLGLGIPPPQRTNVCETLVEELVLSKADVSCDVPWLAPPHCHVPGACHVDPLCKIYEVTVGVTSHVLNAGDLYCDFREIEPETLIEKLAQEQLVDLQKLTTGGTSSVLYNVAVAHMDALECRAKGLNPSLKKAIQNLVQRTSLTRKKSFTPIDIDRVNIVQRSVPMGALYLRDPYDGITLDSLVILQDKHHQILKDWAVNEGDLLFGQVSVAEEAALFLMIHELVHVWQYRDMGRELFINRYLAEAVTNDYPSISTEEEAREFTKLVQDVHKQRKAEGQGILIAVIL